MAFLTRNIRFSAAIGCLLVVSGIACAKTALRGPRVVWVRGDRVYVASPDSVALEPGTLLTFKDRGKSVARGEVAEVHNAELIAARLTSGTLARVKHPEKLEVTAERPAFLPMPMLRVGYPSASRKNLLFDCSNQSLDSSLRLGNYRISTLQGVYRPKVLDDRTYQLVRDSTVSHAASWPDTLLLRLFDDIADEEIALERGDLDVAVFWPGEPSAHIREATGWKPRTDGPHARGALAAHAWQSGLTEDAFALRDNERRALQRLNHVLFRDDLILAPGRSESSALTAPGRFEVDRSLPGRETMEQFLNRVIGTTGPIDTARVVRLLYNEIWPDTPILGGLPREDRLIVRCPVISDPKLRPYLDAINTDAIANLFQCLPAPQKQ